MSAEPRTIRLEEPARLSESKIWELQKAFYLLKGPRAWSERVIPWAVSTNPGVAHAYAHLIVAFLRDCASGAAPLDPDRPLYVIEIGAGSGRLTYLLAKALRRLEGRMPAGGPRPVVVGTDFAEANLEFMRDHPFMEPLIDEGWVDFAQFDADRTARLELEVSGARLAPGETANPVVLIANYVFDSLRNDAFRVYHGDLKEILVTAVQHGEQGPDPVDMQGYDIEITEREVEGACYEDPFLDGLLEEYQSELENTGVLVPVGSMDVLRRVDALSTGPTLVLFGDKANRNLFELEGHQIGGLVKHGSFSVTVNLHALRRWVETRDGLVMNASSPDTIFTHSVMLTGAAEADFTELTLAFEMTIEDWGPREAQRLTWDLYKKLDAPDPMLALHLIRLSGWDPWLYREYFPTILQALVDGRHEPLPFLMHAVGRVAEHVYPIRQGDGTCRQIGRGYQVIGRIREAFEWYRRSLAFDGSQAETWYNIGMCLEYLAPAEAPEAYEEALRLRPGWPEARERLERLVAEE